MPNNNSIVEALRPADISDVAWQKKALLRPTKHLTTINEVIAEETKIRRLYERRPNGIFWFNYFYTNVTKGVHEEVDEKEYGERGGPFILRLDIEFYGLYREALTTDDLTNTVHCAWEPLFQFREDKNTHPILFALAGVNAHILQDLPRAIVRALDSQSVRKVRADAAKEFPTRDSEEYRGFQDLNEVVGKVAARSLDEDFRSGPVGVAHIFFRDYIRHLAKTYIMTTRALAWEQAERLWKVREGGEVPDAQGGEVPNAQGGEVPDAQGGEVAEALELALAASARALNDWMLTKVDLGPNITYEEVSQWMVGRFEAGVRTIREFGATDKPKSTKRARRPGNGA